MIDVARLDPSDDDGGERVLHLFSQLVGSSTAPRSGAQTGDLGSETFILVARDGSEIVGALAGATFSSPLREGSRKGLVDGLFVSADVRGLGVGRSLVEQSLVEFAALGVFRVYVDSRSDRDDAHAFYESCGFEAWAKSFSLDL